MSLFFKFHRVHVSQRKMTTPAVVKHLDVIDDILPGVSSAEICRSKDQLHLESTEKALSTALSQQSPFLLMLDSTSFF